MKPPTPALITNLSTYPIQALFTPSVFNFQFKLRHLYEKNTFLELQCANMNPDGVSAAGDLYSVSTSTVEASANNYLVADGGGGGSNLQVSSSLPSGEMDSPLTGLTSTGNNQQLQQQPFVATNSAANVVGGTAASDAVDEDGTAPMAVDDHEMKTSSVADGESNSNNPTATTTSAEVIAVDQPSSSTTTTTTTSSTTTTHPSGMPLQQHLQKQQHDRLFLPQSPLLPRIIDPIDQVSIPLDIAIARSIARYASTLAQTGLRDRDIDDRVRRICSSVLLM